MAAVTAAAITAGTAIYASNRASKARKDEQAFAREMQEGADPYAQYRAGDAERLQQLVNDPSSIQNTAEYKARMQAAERAMASQGYTGSGNALVAAAEAGGSVYQQAFDNLSMLSGANTGLGNAVSAGSVGASARANANDNYLSSIGGVANNIGNLATVAGDKWNKSNTGAGGGGT